MLGGVAGDSCCGASAGGGRQLGGSQLPASRCWVAAAAGQLLEAPAGGRQLLVSSCRRQLQRGSCWSSCWGAGTCW